MVMLPLSPLLHRSLKNIFLLVVVSPSPVAVLFPTRCVVASDPWLIFALLLLLWLPLAVTVTITTG